MSDPARSPLFLTDRDIDALTSAFMTSDDTEEAYAGRSLDQRLEIFLRHQGLLRLADDGDLYNIFVDRVLTYMSVARRQREATVQLAAN